jgi:hypothetical protein
MARPLGGDTGDPEEPTINEKISTVAPREKMAEIREHAPSTQKNVDGGPPGRRCRRSGSIHHQSKKY